MNKVDFNAYFFFIIMSKLKGATKYKQDIGPNPLEGFNFGQIEIQDIINKQKDLGLPRFFEITSNVLSKNKQAIQKGIEKLMSVNVTLNTFKYRSRLTYKVLQFKNMRKAEDKIQKFFKVASEKLNRELFEMLIVSPGDLSQLCNILILIYR